ncbi:AAA family ATPase [Lacunimicrobium album]
MDIPTSIETHTLSSLLDELISGQPVKDINGVVYTPLTQDARLALQWFKRDLTFWSKDNKADYVDQLIAALKLELPGGQNSTHAIPKITRRYRIKSLRTSRFGGLHEFGDIDSSPEPFEVNFQPSEFNAALIYGRNGCGKSSLLSAISWCLTGWYYTSQGLPNNKTDNSQYLVPAVGEENKDSSIYTAPIIPIPRSEIVNTLTTSNTPVETWVELDIIDENGNAYGPFRRTLILRKGKTSQSFKGDLSTLGISPAGLELGTKLPAMLPHIRLDEKNGFGESVASLVNIQPLSHVATHADKTLQKIKVRLKAVDTDATESNAKLQLAIKALADQVIQLNSDDLKKDISALYTTVSHTTLQAFAKKIAQIRGSMLSKVVDVLGTTDELTSLDSQSKLINHIAIAGNLLETTTLSTSVHSTRLRELLSLGKKDLQQAEDTIETILSEAEFLLELQEKPDHARRIQLYSKIAEWLKDGSQTPSTSCPVCRTDLSNLNDSITDKRIEVHIKECFAEDRQFFSKPPVRWANDALLQLSATIPRQLNPDSPLNPLIKCGDGLIKDLSIQESLNGALSPIREQINKCWHNVKKDLVTESPKQLNLPQQWSDFIEPLQTTITNISYYIDFVTNNNDFVFDDFIDSIFNAEYSVRETLKQLQSIARSVEPFSLIIKKIDEIKLLLVEQDTRAAFRNDLSRLSAALVNLGTVKDLVGNQVQGLLDKLANRQAFWLGLIYIPARWDRPQIANASLSPEGKLSLDARHLGTTAQAHHVTNSSYLRAALVAFWLAYWEYQYSVNGGLCTILLDDIQELFDEENQIEFARAIKEISFIGAQVVLATNKMLFFHDIEWTQFNAKRWHIDWRPGDPVIHLLDYREDLEKKMKNFSVNQSDDDAVQLAASVRTYCERRLIGLFRHIRPHTLGDKPTLMDAISAVRHRNNSRTAPFDSKPVIDLLQQSGCTPGTLLYQLMNDSHHGRHTLITANKVKSLMGEITGLISSVEQVWDHCQSSKFKLSAQLKPKSSISAITPLQSHQLPTNSIPIWTSVAAATTSLLVRDVEDTHQEFNWIDLGDIAIFQVLSDSLGQSAPRYSRVIVALDGRKIQSDSLVIAFRDDRVFARRLIEFNHQSEVVLHSEAVDPRRRAPAEVLTPESGNILPIIGVIWDDTRPLLRAKGEAQIDNEFKIDSLKLEVAQNVEGESAEPLVLANQFIIVGPEINLLDIHKLIERPVVVEVQDTNGEFKRYLKKISGVTHGANKSIQVFNSIGGKGEPLIAQFANAPNGDKLKGLPEIVRVRPMQIVLYETAIGTAR